MKNMIDKVITLSDNSRYMVIDQGNYDGKGYYLASKLDEDGNLKEEFVALENNNGIVTTVEDEALFNALIGYFKNRVDAY